MTEPMEPIYGREPKNNLTVYGKESVLEIDHLPELGERLPTVCGSGPREGEQMGWAHVTNALTNPPEVTIHLFPGWEAPDAS